MMCTTMCSNYQSVICSLIIQHKGVHVLHGFLSTREAQCLTRQKESHDSKFQELTIFGSCHPLGHGYITHTTRYCAIA